MRYCRRSLIRQWRREEEQRLMLKLSRTKAGYVHLPTVMYKQTSRLDPESPVLSTPDMTALLLWSTHSISTWLRTDLLLVHMVYAHDA